ncbi:hypothetical protein EG329_008454 [Mollisiaceae sp. DMI_Dod_QoI]|nr:hypothetical protein EG329_008454 [Helotiales sp. DMI_Dod_QoI]
MPTDLNQILYLGGLPKGMKFYLESVRPWIPEGNTAWSARFSSTKGSAWINKTVYRNPSNVSKTFPENKQGKGDNFKYPVEISTSDNQGKIGEVKLVGYNGIWAKGKGGVVHFNFRIEGTTIIDGKAVSIYEKGHFTVSSTDWKGLERPDWSIISYNWPPLTQFPEIGTATVAVPGTMAGMPADLYFLFGAKSGSVGMNCTTEREAVSMLMDLILQGIFESHKAMFKWVFGKLVPFSAIAPFDESSPDALEVEAAKEAEEAKKDEEDKEAKFKELESRANF